MKLEVKKYLQDLENTRQGIAEKAKTLDQEERTFQENQLIEQEKFYIHLAKETKSLSEESKSADKLEAEINQMLEIRLGDFLKSFKNRANLSSYELKFDLSTTPIINNPFYYNCEKDYLIDKLSKENKITLILQIAETRVLGGKVHFRKRVTLPLDFKFKDGSILKDHLAKNSEFHSQPIRGRKCRVCLSLVDHFYDIPLKFTVADLEKRSEASKGWRPFGKFRDSIIACASRKSLNENQTM